MGIRSAYVYLRDYILRHWPVAQPGKTNVLISVLHHGEPQVPIQPAGHAQGDQLAYHGAAYWRTDALTRGIAQWNIIVGTGTIAGDRVLCQATVRFELLKLATLGGLYHPPSPNVNSHKVEENITYAGYRPMIRVTTRSLPDTFYEYDWKISS